MRATHRGTKNMKVICAWCGFLIRPGEHDLISHGLCLGCYDQHFKARLNGFQPLPAFEGRRGAAPPANGHLAGARAGSRNLNRN